MSARATWRRERTEAAVVALVANGLSAKDARRTTGRVLRAADRAVKVCPLTPERAELERGVEIAESSAREWLLELTCFVAHARALRIGLEHVADLVERRRRFQTISEALDAVLDERPPSSDATGVDELLAFRVEVLELALELGLEIDPRKPAQARDVLATKVRPQIKRLLREQVAMSAAGEV